MSELKVGQLRVKNSRYFDLDRIKDSAPSLKEGSVPNFTDVTKDIVSLNQWPDRRVTPALRAGVTPGTVDVDLNVEDKAPFRQPRSQQPAIALHYGEPRLRHRALRQSVAARPFAELHLSGRAGTAERRRGVLRLLHGADTERRLAQSAVLRREVEQQCRDRSAAPMWSVPV